MIEVKVIDFNQNWPGNISFSHNFRYGFRHFSWRDIFCNFFVMSVVCNRYWTKCAQRFCEFFVYLKLNETDSKPVDFPTVPFTSLGHCRSTTLQRVRLMNFVADCRMLCQEFFSLVHCREIFFFSFRYFLFSLFLFSLQNV